MDDDKQTLVDAEIRKFLSLQSERCLTYTMFNDAHKIYLDSGDEKAFIHFRHIVDDVTQDFKRISLAIMQIEKILSDKYDEKMISSLIREIQKHERTKLTLTAQLQIQLKEQQDDPSDEVEDRIASTKRNLSETVNLINEVVETIKYEMDG